MPNAQAAKSISPKRVQTVRVRDTAPSCYPPMAAVEPDVVLVNGEPERHPEGAYYLEWREEASVSACRSAKMPQDAAARRQRKEAELNALNNGVSVLPENGEWTQLGCRRSR